MSAELLVTVAKLETRTEAHAETILRNGDRITVLEKWQYGVMGAIALLGLQVPITVSLAVAWLRSKP